MPDSKNSPCSATKDNNKLSDQISCLHGSKAGRKWAITPRMLRSEPMQRCKLGECRAACCLYGVWIDELEAEDILKHAELIKPFLTCAVEDASQWFDGRTDTDPFTRSGKVIHSLVIEDEKHYGGSACVFLRQDHKCALQVAAEKHKLHPWRFKPFYCILHPLDLDENGRITLDETETLLDEPASCLRPARAPIPLLETFEPELSYLLGENQYRQMREMIEKIPDKAD